MFYGCVWVMWCELSECELSMIVCVCFMSVSVCMWVYMYELSVRELKCAKNGVRKWRNDEVRVKKGEWMEWRQKEGVCQCVLSTLCCTCFFTSHVLWTNINIIKHKNRQEQATIRDFTIKRRKNSQKSLFLTSCNTQNTPRHNSFDYLQKNT